MIRILQVFSILNAGGMENYVMNLYRRIDRTQIQFDFLVHHRARGLFEDEIESMGGKVYHFSVMDDKNIPKYCAELNRFFRTHPEYKIVHGHLSSVAFFYLGYARMHGVPHRICHSHSAGFLHTPKGYAKYLFSRAAKWNANVRLACSAEAGRYLYGKSAFTFVPNGINCGRFAYDARTRTELRRELGVEADFVVGHVGRFTREKNHTFLLSIFQSLLADVPTARLLLLGDGEQWDSVRLQARQLGIADYVIFAGVHKDCERYYQAMDVFVLPSLFEGLPVSGIEAQYAGLPCFFADTISREAAITASAKFLGIRDADIPLWCHELKAAAIAERKAVADLTTDAFDVDAAVRNMAQLYQNLWEKESC